LGPDLQVAMAGNRHQDVAVFIEKGAPSFGNQAVGRGFYEPAIIFGIRRFCTRTAKASSEDFMSIPLNSVVAV
jgi:hypothetical protein